MLRIEAQLLACQIEREDSRVITALARRNHNQGVSWAVLACLRYCNRSYRIIHPREWSSLKVAWKELSV
jgi:hypothetical protein